MKHRAVVLSTVACLFLSACSQSPERLIESANKYHDKQKYKEASILYRKAISKDKTNAEAYYREGLNLMDQQNPVEASKFLRRAVDLKGDNVDAASKLAEIYLAAYATNPKKLQNVVGEVRDLDAKILKKDSNSYAGLRVQGFLALIDNQPGKALDSFEKANKVKPHSRDMVVLYAQTLAASNRFPEAESLIRDMIANDKKWAQSYDFLFVQYMQRKQPEQAEAILKERLQNDPQNTIPYSNLANFYLGTKRPDQAEAVIKQALDRKDLPLAHQLAGDFFSRTQRHEKALAEYQAGIKEDSKNKLQYEQRVVSSYILQGKKDEALKLSRQLVKDNPKNVSATEIYASLLLDVSSRDQISKSLDEIKKLSQDNPNNPILRYDLARAYATVGDNEHALAEVQQAIRVKSDLLPARILAARLYQQHNEPNKALEQSDAVLNTQPNNPDARLSRAMALVGLNDKGKALPELEALVAQYPQSNEARYQLANLYIAGSQTAKATEQYQKLASSNPPDPRGEIGLQTVKLQQGNSEEAVKGIQALADKNPNRLDYRYMLANFQAKAGADAWVKNEDKGKQLLKQAESNYKLVLNGNPKANEVWLRLGAVQKQMNENDAALASFNKVPADQKGGTEALLNKGMILEALNKKKEAGEMYKQILGLDPDNAVALNNLAFLTADSGDNLDQAMTLAERAKKKMPNNLNVSDTLGYVYYQKNLNSAALNIFQQVVQNDPKNSLFRYHLAMALLKKGDREGAKREATSALAFAAPAEKEKIRSFASQI